MRPWDQRKLKALQDKRLKTISELTQIEDKIKEINGKYNNNPFATNRFAALATIDDEDDDSVESWIKTAGYTTSDDESSTGTYDSDDTLTSSEEAEVRIDPADLWREQRFLEQQPWYNHNQTPGQPIQAPPTPQQLDPIAVQKEQEARYYQTPPQTNPPPPGMHHANINGIPTPVPTIQPPPATWRR